MEKSLSGVTTLFQVLGIQFFSVHSDTVEEGIHHRGKVSNKHKLSLIFITACLSLDYVAIYYAITLEKAQEQNQNVNTGLFVQYFTYILTNFAVKIAVINAYLTTEKSRLVFCELEKVSKIFQNEFKEIIDFGEFSKQFKLTMIKISLFYVVGYCAALIFVYNHNQSNILLWAVIAVFPYFFLTVFLSYLIFFVKITNLNLSCMGKVIEKLHNGHALLKLRDGIHIEVKPQRKSSDELYDSFLILKRIYGCLFETTCMINEVLGVPLIFLIVDMIMVNILGGYKLYLSVMGDVYIGRIGGSKKMIKVFK